MAEMTVQDTLLTKVATFVQEATPKLEKQAADQQAWAAQCPGMVDSMIQAGVLQASHRDQAINNLVTGGLEKAAQLIPFLSSRVTVPSQGGPHGGPQGQEKRAGYANPVTKGMKDSDRVWQEGMTS